MWESWKMSHNVSRKDDRLEVTCILVEHPQKARLLLLGCVMLAMTLADMTPISQIKKLSFKVIYVSFSRSFLLPFVAFVNHRFEI